MSEAGSIVSMMIERNRKQKKDELYIQKLENSLLINRTLELTCMVPKTIMILEDQFKSNYDCKVCKCSGQIEEKCLKCDGGGKFLANQDGDGVKKYVCGKCDGKGILVKECRDCNGKGALLEIPDQAKGRPTSGVIVSMGPECTIWTLGNRVVYSGYIGNLLPFKQNDRIRIMRETEPFALITEHGEGDDGSEKLVFIDKDNAYDLT